MAKKANPLRQAREWDANQKGWRDYMLDLGYRPETVEPSLRSAYRRGYLEAEAACARRRCSA